MPSVAVRPADGMADLVGNDEQIRIRVAAYGRDCAGPQHDSPVVGGKGREAPLKRLRAHVPLGPVAGRIPAIGDDHDPLWLRVAGVPNRFLATGHEPADPAVRWNLIVRYHRATGSKHRSVVTAGQPLEVGGDRLAQLAGDRPEVEQDRPVGHVADPHLPVIVSLAVHAHHRLLEGDEPVGVLCVVLDGGRRRQGESEEDDADNRWLQPCPHLDAQTTNSTGEHHGEGDRRLVQIVVVGDHESVVPAEATLESRLVVLEHDVVQRDLFEGRLHLTSVP